MSRESHGGTHKVAAITNYNQHQNSKANRIPPCRYTTRVAEIALMQESERLTAALNLADELGRSEAIVLSAVMMEVDRIEVRVYNYRPDDIP